MYEEISDSAGSDSAGSDSAIQNNSAENISVSVKSAENTLHDSELINIFPELANLDKYDFDRQTEIFEQILSHLRRELDSKSGKSGKSDNPHNPVNSGKYGNPGVKYDKTQITGGER